MRYPPALQPDLFQEGIIGLLAAIERFDTSRGVRLSTLAVWWIRAYVSRAARRMGALSTVCSSLDTDTDEHHGRTLLERTYDRTAALPDEAVLDRHRAQELRRMLALLLPQDREALEHWLGDDGCSVRTWVEVGELMGISRETARKYVNRALGALRADAGVVAC
jgi:RNA polymerase sigma factor (sigma-70 family)